MPRICTPKAGAVTGHRPTTRRRLLAVVGAAILIAAFGGPAALADAGRSGHQNLIVNGSFEYRAGTTNTPRSWTADSWMPSARLVRDNRAAHKGHASGRIVSSQPNDARWTQTVAVQRDTRYLLTGWIKTRRVAHTVESVDAGATLGIYGRWEHTTAMFGTTPWRRVSLTVDSGDDTSLVVAARLGFWAGTTTGTAWFDDISLTRVGRTPPAATWRVLTLIYPRTDITVTDRDGVRRHLVGQMSQAQVRAAATASRAFVTTDIPALTSGQMVATATVRVVEHGLTTLEPIGDAWWPSPTITAADLDPRYDAVVVIWEPDVVDQATGASSWIGTAAGLTPGRGTGQTYTALIVAAATEYGHRNVFKHEFGHSLLSYFDAVGTSPRPAVDNHADAGSYVHCGSGRPYVWQDETLAHPVPNSIYHNTSGFTHDYYSGTTARPSDPTHCLGITREAWASGSPASPRAPARVPAG